MDPDWLDLFFSYPELYPNRTGHGPVPAGAPTFGGRFGYDDSRANATRNLGLGWLYYALVRMHVVRTGVCIGSGRGFAPIILARAMRDNGMGSLVFIDPSLDDDFWQDAESVRNWFEKFGVAEYIRHYLMTTEEFTQTSAYSDLGPVDLLFIDGSHLYEDVKFDFEAFRNKMADAGIVAFHDAVSRSMNTRWQGPRKLLLELEQDADYQIFDFRLGAGLALLQRRSFVQSADYLTWSSQQWGSKDPRGF